MNPLRSLWVALFPDVCADLRDLPLDACRRQDRVEMLAMMEGAGDRAIIARHNARHTFLRSRIADLQAQESRGKLIAVDGDLYAMPPR